MNNVKKSFGIRDLENLTGIKAHTIRIWEKRYGLLSPERSETNIRSYSLSSLQKLLNITLLYNNGYKISKIAALQEQEIKEHVKTLVNQQTNNDHAISAFKLAMINFDLSLFQQTYSSLLSEKPFREIFWDVFIPFLNEIGLLWQTDTIGPAHEHFITHLIKQKILTSTEKIQIREAVTKDRVFVLFLPENEIHDIGLLFVNYELLERGYHTVYLGPTIPVEHLRDLFTYYDDPVFLSYFTVDPSPDQIASYLKTFKANLLDAAPCELWILGRQTENMTLANLPDNVRTFESIEALISQV